MLAAYGLELGAKLGRIGHGHVRRVEQSPSGGPTAALRPREPPVDRLADDRRDRYTALSRGGGNALVTLVVKENLQPMAVHAHTVAC